MLRANEIVRRSAGVAALAVALVLSATCTLAQTSDPTEIPADWPPPLDTSMRFYWLGIDQLEWRGNDGADAFRWDLQGWWGTDRHKAWLKSEGERSTEGPSAGDAEVQLLYSRMIAPFWDAQIGVRQDFLFGAGPNRERTFGVLGVQGLARYWFELEPSLFVSDDGDVSFRLTGTYDLYVTQRLVAQPRLELNAAASDARRFGIESGVNDIELGLRLRYEIRREFAPYLGVNWLRRLGDTADLARTEGEDIDVLGGVVGIRIQF